MSIKSTAGTVLPSRTGFTTVVVEFLTFTSYYYYYKVADILVGLEDSPREDFFLLIAMPLGFSREFAITEGRRGETGDEAPFSSPLLCTPTWLARVP